MHEVAIMEEAVAIACEQAQQQNAKKIIQFKMRIGAMSSVVPEALNFAFEVVTVGTLAEQARLEIETIPVTCFCSRCDRPFSPPDLFYECPECGTISNKILTGKEIELASLEII